MKEQSIHASAEKALLAKEDVGASMIEYVFLAALIAVVCVAGVTFLGQEASTTFSAAGHSFCNGPVC